MTVGFPAALPPPLSSLRRGGGLQDGWQQREEAIEIVIMNGSGWPPAPPLFNNPIITGSTLTGDPSAAAARLKALPVCIESECTALKYYVN